MYTEPVLLKYGKLTTNIGGYTDIFYHVVTLLVPGLVYFAHIISMLTTIVVTDPPWLG